MKNYPKITLIILGVLARNGSNAKELSERTGIPYATLIQTRFPDPMSWKFCEIRAVFENYEFFPDEIRAIGKEVCIYV